MEEVLRCADQAEVVLETVTTVPRPPVLLTPLTSLLGWSIRMMLDDPWQGIPPVQREFGLSTMVEAGRQISDAPFDANLDLVSHQQPPGLLPKGAAGTPAAEAGPWTSLEGKSGEADPCLRLGGRNRPCRGPASWGSSGGPSTRTTRARGALCQQPSDSPRPATSGGSCPLPGRA